jgi:hypothetical protein
MGWWSRGISMTFLSEVLKGESDPTPEGNSLQSSGIKGDVKDASLKASALTWCCLDKIVRK